MNLFGWNIGRENKLDWDVEFRNCVIDTRHNDFFIMKEKGNKVRLVLHGYRIVPLEWLTEEDQVKCNARLAESSADQAKNSYRVGGGIECDLPAGEK